ncbi:MAG: hypothetical protein RR867_00150 [Ruthenibacterium sp.]
MQSRHSESGKIALCGVFGALAVVMMLMGSVIPFATFVAPAFAGILIVPVVIEYGFGSGILLYTAISLLALFLAPDKEMALIFIFFLGYYPMAKAKLDRIHAKIVQWFAKIALFNVSIVAMYSGILLLFPIASVVAEFEESGVPLLGLLLAMGNVTFVLYDIALCRIIGLYMHKLRPRFVHHH